MSVKWLIPGPNAKIFAQSIHCLAKLGDDLYIEGWSNRLVLRTINLSKTAFASVIFNADFFSYFPVIDNDDGPRCQIAMKAALTVLRIPASMDKSVENCAFSCSPDSVELKLKFKKGFVKTNTIQLAESEVLQASYEDTELPSRIAMEAKILVQLLASFQTQEITWAVTPTEVKFRNFSTLNEDTGGLRSEVYVAPEDLMEHAMADGEAELTFCLAELRTILTFADQINSPLICSFSCTGSPMFFVVDNQIVRAHVVLSTLGASNTQSTMLSQQPPSHAGSQRLTQVERSYLSQTEYFPSQTLRNVLRRQSFDIAKLPGYHEVLAPDSDEEA